MAKITQECKRHLTTVHKIKNYINTLNQRLKNIIKLHQLEEKYMT